MKKVSFIGAGSGCFCLSVVKSMCQSKMLGGYVISLMDINEQKLDVIYNIARKYATEINADIEIQKTTDRIESISGAEFVVTTALAAGYDRMLDGWKIAQKYGFKFGGSLHILHDEAFWINFYQFKLFEAITEDMLVHCPDAWHLMVSNPVISGTTHLQRKYPKAKMVGLCHGYQMVNGLANSLGYDKKSLAYEIAGVNHFIWLNRAYAGNENLYPVLDKWIKENAEEHWQKCGISDTLGRKRLDFYQKHGIIGVGDTTAWSGGCWPWWYHSDDDVEKSYGEYNPMDGWNSYFDMTSKNAKWIDKMSEMAKRGENIREELETVWTDELFIPLLESLAGDVPRVLAVNMLNKNYLVPGLPEDFQVEILALCSKNGIAGIQTSPLPRHIISHILRDMVAPVEMELAAFNEGRFDFLVELVLMDKWATSLKQVRDFVGEILDLPYHKDMKAHYK
jgi:alpha-galactosidase